MAALSRRSVIAGLSCACVAVGACGLSTSGTGVDLLTELTDGSTAPGVDATTGSDGSVTGPDDASVGAADADADGGDAGARSDASSPKDAGVTTDAEATDAGTSLKYVCPSTGTAVASCASCASHPVACALCGAGGAHQTFCTTAGAACLDSAEAGFNWCACSGQDASACLLGLQECYSDGTYNNICITCGENKSNGYKCKAGGACSQGAGTCN